MLEDDAVMHMHRRLGYYLYIFPSLLLLTGLFRSLYYSIRNARMNYAIDAESQGPVAWRTYPPSALSNWFKRYVQYPALFRGRHRKPIGWYTFPTRIETILVASYWMLNVIFLVVHRTGKVNGRMVDSVKIIGDRAGTLSLWNLPVFFLLAGRNDFLVWLTGWSYSTFHVFHKWIARVSALMALVHSLAYAIYMYQVGPEKRGWNKTYWFNGIAATTTMGVILVLSLFPFRKKAYEFFLFCHIVCAVLFLVFLFHHLKLSKTKDYDGWIWACVTMWAFDRFARLLRLLILNVRAFSSNPDNHHVARAKFVKGTDIIQLTVYPSAGDVGYFPGAHFFVFLTGSWRFWECHPFTAADWRPAGPVLTGMPSRSPSSGARSSSNARSSNSRSSSSRSSSNARSSRFRSSNSRSSSNARSQNSRSSSNARSLPDPLNGPLGKELRGGGELRGGDLGLRGGAFDASDMQLLGLRGGDLHKQKSRNIYIVKQTGKDRSIFIVTADGKERGIFPDSGAGTDVIDRTPTPKERDRSRSAPPISKELAKAKLAKAQEVARAKEASAKAKEATRAYEMAKAKELARINELAKARLVSRSRSLGISAPERERAQGEGRREQPASREPRKPQPHRAAKEERAARSRARRAERLRRRKAELEEEKYVPDLRGINEEEDADPEKLALRLASEEEERDIADEREEMDLEKEIERERQIRKEEEEAIRRRAIELEEDEGDLTQILVGASTSGSLNRNRRGPPRPKLTFLIKPRKGMTATLAGMIRSHDEQQRGEGRSRIKELEIKCLIEGAYGINRPLHLFETAIVIAGGVGVTTILPYLADFVERTRGPDRRTLTRRFVFVWTAREEELVENVIVKRFPNGVLTRRDISLQLYVTRKKPEGAKKMPGVRYRRPKIEDIIETERKNLLGRMAVLSCGPSILVDITRNAVVECLGKERKHVQYFEESYGW